MVVSLALVFLFVGSLAFAQVGAAPVAVTTSAKAMIVDKERMRLDGDTARVAIRARLGNVSDDDLDRIRVLGLDVERIRELDATNRDRLMVKIRARVSNERLAEFRTVESDLRVRNARIASIREANATADARLRWIARLKLAEESATDLGDEAVRTELAATRVKLEAATTVTPALETEVAARMLKLHRENTEMRGEKAIVLATRISTTLADFTTRVETSLADKDAPRAREVLVKLKAIQVNLSASIDAAKAAQVAVQADTATRDDVVAFHKALVEMKVYATRAAAAMKALVMAWNGRGDKTDIDTTVAVDISDAVVVSDVDVQAEVNAEVNATAAEPAMEDHEAMEGDGQ